MRTLAGIEAESALGTTGRALPQLSLLASVLTTLGCGALSIAPAVSRADEPVVAAETAASYDFLRAIDGVNDAGIFIANMVCSMSANRNGAGRLFAGRRPSLTSSLQQAGRFSGLQVRCPIRSLTTSRQWRYSATHRTAWESL